MPFPSPNLHHLELFYHVAKAGGITAATRAMSYGIQQPAVSGQIALLEKDLGVRLFQRRPFQLTPAGKALYEFLAPFFGKLPEVAARIAGRASSHLRLAAPTTAAREHLPQVIADMLAKKPDIELTLIDAGQREVFGLLEREEVDLAITEIDGPIPSGVHMEALASLPLVLLLPRGFRMPREGIDGLAGNSPLIRLPSNTAVSRLFEKGLARHGLNWPPSIEVGAVDLVNTYVAKGLGTGLSVRIPGMRLPPGVTAVDLVDFPELVIAGLWRGKLHPLGEQVLAGLRTIARGSGVKEPRG